MKRLTTLAGSLLLLAGCGPADGTPKAGGVYVLTSTTLVCMDGPGSERQGLLDPGTIVRVLGDEKDDIGLRHAKLYVERNPPDRLGLADGYTGKTVWTFATSFDAAPTDYD